MTKTERLLSILSSILVLLLTAGLVTMTAVNFAFIATELAMRAQISTPDWADWIVDATLTHCGYDLQSLKDDPDTFENVVALFLSSSLRAVTIWFTLIPIVAYVQHRRAIQRAAVVDVHKVRKVGKSDLRTMLRYYRRGDHITIFSGDFEWILTNRRLRELMVNKGKASKLLLVSYKKQDEIRKEWRTAASECALTQAQAEEILTKLQPCFRFHDRHFKFSFIDWGQGHTAFLSLVPKASLLGKDCNIGVHSGKSHLAHSLLHIVGNLCDIEHCKNLPGWNGEPEEAANEGKDREHG